MTVEYYLNFLCREVEPIIPCSDKCVEAGGRMWDLVTGAQRAVVFVTGYGNRASHRSFNRYSRRDRFLTLLMDTYDIGNRQVVIMRCFDVLLARWKQGRSLLVRKYFLNLRVVNYLIPVHLNLPPPCVERDCLRDPYRFEKQRTIFQNLMGEFFS